MITGSHVQRLLVHVHMYTMYYLSVVLVLHKDVVRLCSYRVKGGGSYRKFYQMFNERIDNAFHKSIVIETVFYSFIIDLR